jgi:uncharacterized protein (TIGR03435 family)
MRTVVIAVTLVAVMGGLVRLWGAQESEQSAPAFEVASVRPSSPERLRGIPIRSLRPRPGRWLMVNVNLFQVIGAAYPDYRFEGRVVGGPAWVRKDRFDIEARMDPAITAAGVAPLVARLLADRFALRTHTEQRPVAVYLLKTARDDGRLGSQLKRSDPSCVEAKAARQLSPECRGVLPVSGGWNLRAGTMDDFLTWLAINGIDRPVLDRTGLTGYFDIQLVYQCGPFAGPSVIAGPFGSRPCGTEGVSFFTALQEQAGLKLEPAREVVDVLVIDAVEQPTPN